MSHKKFVMYFLAIIFLPPIGMIILLYLYDPLQFWHKPYFRETTFSQDMRVQNKGIIKHYDFDAFIVGSSMVEHVPIKQLNELLGGKWVNIMMYGSSFDERSIIMRYLFRVKKPKQIIYSLDYDSLMQDSKNKDYYFDYIYDDNEFNDMLIYFDKKFKKCALIWSNNSNCVGIKKHLELNQALSVRFGNFINWLKYEDARVHNVLKFLRSYNDKEKSEIIATNSSKIELYKNYIKQYLFNFIINNPDTHFYLIIPPYSRLFWKAKQANFYTWKHMVSWLINELNQVNNVTIYGFDDMDYPDNIANYMDTAHYNVDMHEYFIDSIYNKQHILTIDNIDNYLDIMEQKIKDYDLEPLIKIINEYDKKHKK